MLTKIIKILILVLVITNSTAILAQERTGPPPPTNTRGPELPIDDNIIILIVLGILYGVYITYKKHQIKDTLQ